MSGGSMNYLCHRVENDAIFSDSTPLRTAFSAHLKAVAKALHDIEWVDSCDYSPGDEDAAIVACLVERSDLIRNAVAEWRAKADAAEAKIARPGAEGAGRG